MIPLRTPRLIDPCRIALAILACAAVLPTTQAQDFTLQVADADPLGLGAFIPGAGFELADGLTDGIKGDLMTALKAGTVYHSNFFLSDGGEDDEWAFTLAPTLRYVSDPEGGAEKSITLSYHPVGRSYAENSTLDGIDHSGDLTFQWRGAKSSLAAFARYNELSASDRLTGEFVSGSLITTGLRLTRQLAPYTRANAGFSAGISDYSGGGHQGAEVYSVYGGALWQATARTHFGGTLRGTVTESGTIATREALAVLVEARHQSGERVWFSGSLGPEFARTGDGGEDSLRLSGELSARVALGERWTWTSSLRSASVPSPSETQYLVNDIGLVTKLRRQLLHGWLGGGLEYHFSDYQNLGGATALRSDEHNAAVFLSYGRPLFSERATGDISVRHAVNNGQVDWQQWQVSAGVSLAF
jgi:hypothetical protein